LRILLGPGLIFLLSWSSSLKIFIRDNLHELKSTKDKLLVIGACDIEVGGLKTLEKYWEKQLEISSPPVNLILL